MSERFIPRDPAELEPVSLERIFSEGAFTVLQAYDHEAGEAQFRIVEGDCLLESGADPHGFRCRTLYPGDAIEVWENGGRSGRSLTPRIVENDGGVAEVHDHRPRVKSRLKKQNVTLERPLF